MKLKETIELLNEQVKKRLNGKYVLSFEKVYNVYKLNKQKNIVLFTSIAESQFEKFNKQYEFMYCISEPTYHLCLKITNTLGVENVKYIGRFETRYNELFFRFTNPEFKRLKAFLRGVLYWSHQKIGHFHPIHDFSIIKWSEKNNINVSEEFPQLTNIKVKKIDVYKILLSNNQNMIMNEKNMKMIFDHVIKNSLNIIQVEKTISYIEA